MKETFHYPFTHRITSLPSFVFLLALFMVILVAPETLWGEEPEDSARQGALAFLGIMILVVGAAALRRLREPVEITLAPDGLHARRTIGGPLFLPYDSIEKISEHPRNFLRPVPDLHIEGAGSSIPVNARIENYERLRELVVARASPLANINLVEPSDKGR